MNKVICFHARCFKSGQIFVKKVLDIFAIVFCHKMLGLNIVPLIQKSSHTVALVLEGQSHDLFPMIDYVGDISKSTNYNQY